MLQNVDAMVFGEVFSNFEKKVAESIKEMVVQKNLENEVSEVLVPTEEVLEIRRGKKVQRREDLCLAMCS